MQLLQWGRNHVTPLSAASCWMRGTRLPTARTFHGALADTRQTARQHTNMKLNFYMFFLAKNSRTVPLVVN
eukprot:562821-Amphidinium_carterae.1